MDVLIILPLQEALSPTREGLLEKGWRQISNMDGGNMDGRWRGVGGDDGDDLLQFPIPAGCQNGVPASEIGFREAAALQTFLWNNFEPPTGFLVTRIL